MKKSKEKIPSAIVLCNVLTGLSTVRGLSAAGIEVHAVTFSENEPVHFSNRCHQIKLSGMKNDEAGLIHWLIGYAKKLGNQPVVIPTSDSHALMLAKHYEILVPLCRLSTVSYKDLRDIISKGYLYSLAKTAGVDVIPSISEPSLTQLDAWCDKNLGPYFLKPFYEAVDGCALKYKNLILPNRESLLDYVDSHGSKSVVVQRMIEGGDGYIFDCYGLCDVSGKVVTMASHRRWRQNPPHVGTTTYGEIPGHPEGGDESILFDNTVRLLGAIRYHGIFGIEWLQDKKSEKLYLIDFNARPFTSIGHLRSCGLNLPFLNYQELVGSDLSGVELTPHLNHKFWVDMLRDLQSLPERQTRNEFDLLDWFRSVLRCRSAAYWDWRDPMPGLYRLWKTVSLVVHFLWKKLMHKTSICST